MTITTKAVAKKSQHWWFVEKPKITFVSIFQESDILLCSNDCPKEAEVKLLNHHNKYMGGGLGGTQRYGNS